MESFFQWMFFRWAIFCYRYWYIVLPFTLAIFIGFSFGILQAEITEDPVDLWTAPTAQTRIEKKHFDENFSPFFRVQQLIIRPKNLTRISMPIKSSISDEIIVGPIFNKDFLREVLSLQQQIEAIIGVYKSDIVYLKDICFAPLSPDNNECTIQSALNYFQNNASNLDHAVSDVFGYVLADYFDHLVDCFKNPTAVVDSVGLGLSCLGTYGGPIFPWVALGDFEGDNYTMANNLVITILVKNSINIEEIERAKAWELNFINFMEKFTSENMTISFLSERSIEDEISTQGGANIPILLLSYAILFVYIAIVLGQFRYSFRTILVDMKVSLALSGVTIVLLSVASATGFYSFCGMPLTLIVVEVVPFLVLAVGVDNIFILVQTLQRDQRLKNETLEHQVARVISVVGPSMMLTSVSESMAFFFGALTNMPAVRSFSFYAGLSVLFNFILQMTAFVCLMCLDFRRASSHRYDIAYCVKSSSSPHTLNPEGSFFYILFKRFYVPIITNNVVKVFVVAGFLGAACYFGSLLPKIEIGLDQKMAMSPNSYVRKYFEDQSNYLEVGPPLYFVLKGNYDYSNSTKRKAICSYAGCNEGSLYSQIRKYSTVPEYSRIAKPPNSWLDDYISWLTPDGANSCCRVNNGTFCKAKMNATCNTCLSRINIGNPTEDQFYQYLPWFLSDNPGLACSKGGHAAYGDAVTLKREGGKVTAVKAAYYSTYHTVLKDSGDFIDALKKAKKLAKEMTELLDLEKVGAEIYPYSVFYVFYEQYLTIIEDALKNICICLGVVFCMTFILLGFDIVSALITIIVISMILLSMIGAMVIFQIPLNAVSIVNLVMSIGISVEFCSHIIRAFVMSPHPTRQGRTIDSLINVGSSVVTGVAMTNLPPTLVLYWAPTELFQVFYFRMYMAVLVSALLHGIVFLPVVLSFIGPGLRVSATETKIQDFLSVRKPTYIEDMTDNSYVNTTYDSPISSKL